MQEFLKGICSDLHLVQGDFDDFESPDHEVSPHWYSLCRDYHILWLAV